MTSTNTKTHSTRCGAGQAPLRPDVPPGYSWNATRNYRINGDTNQAAAIALYGILSIIPLFILTLLVVGSLFSANPEIEQKLIDGIRRFVPSFRASFSSSSVISKERGRFWEASESLRLIWFSAMIFSAIETALDITFRSKTHRKYLASKLLAIGMIPMGGRGYGERAGHLRAHPPGEHNPSSPKSASPIYRLSGAPCSASHPLCGDRAVLHHCLQIIPMATVGLKTP